MKNEESHWAIHYWLFSIFTFFILHFQSTFFIFQSSSFVIQEIISYFCGIGIY